jgi:hypothetical protein
MNNKNVIYTIKNLYEKFKSEMPNEQTFKFTKDDVSMDHTGITIDGCPIDSKAQKSLMTKMRVRPEFIEIAEKADPKDWSVIVETLKTELKERPFYAKVRRTDEREEIYSILEYPVYETVDLISNDKSIECICENLANTKDSYKMFTCTFDRNNNTINIGLINEDTKFSIFGEKDGQEFGFKDDVWMSGVQYTFTDTMFAAKHLVERLICANGMTTKEEGYTTHINKKNFNQEKIEEIITKTFEEPYKEITKKIAKQAAILKENEISVREFYDFTKPFIKAAKEIDMVDEVKEIFDETPFFQNYGLDVAKMSTKWKGTAKTGINAYDFFNALTYTATHVFSGAAPSVITDLQLKVSNFFFKDVFDISEIAPDNGLVYDTTHTAFK